MLFSNRRSYAERKKVSDRRGQKSWLGPNAPDLPLGGERRGDAEVRFHRVSGNLARQGAAASMTLTETEPPTSAPQRRHKPVMLQPVLISSGWSIGRGKTCTTDCGWCTQPPTERSKDEIDRASVRAVVKLPVHQRVPAPNARENRQQRADEKHAASPQPCCSPTIHTSNVSHQRPRATGDIQAERSRGVCSAWWLGGNLLIFHNLQQSETPSLNLLLVCPKQIRRKVISWRSRRQRRRTWKLRLDLQSTLRSSRLVNITPWWTEWLVANSNLNISTLALQPHLASTNPRFPKGKPPICKRPQTTSSYGEKVYHAQCRPTLIIRRITSRWFIELRRWTSSLRSFPLGYYASYDDRVNRIKLLPPTFGAVEA